MFQLLYLKQCSDWMITSTNTRLVFETFIITKHDMYQWMRERERERERERKSCSTFSAFSLRLCFNKSEEYWRKKCTQRLKATGYYFQIRYKSSTS